MWDKMIWGYDVYHVLLWFFTYSILGWIVESIYMSICNRKLTNRGFSRGPVCPIYGVGALSVFFLLQPYQHNFVLLYVLGAFLATALEWMTAQIMLKVFGEIWWDYSEKPFNYKGILCLESTVAWGFYTVALFLVLHRLVEGIVERIPVQIGQIAGVLLAVGYMIDFSTVLYRKKRSDLEEFFRKKGFLV